ncbi:hypothetical protein ACWGK7_01215 [Sphingomonas aurantiaca]
MPRTTTTITIFLASPSDVAPERELVGKTIYEWNQINGPQRSVLFELIRWEDSISAGFGSDGQDVINRQVDDKYDILIALFWTRLGSHTPRAGSGTVEEYERALARYKSDNLVSIAFYFKDVVIDPRSHDLGQLAKVYEFEKQVQSEGALSKRYKDDDGLRYEINLLLDRSARKVGGLASSAALSSDIGNSFPGSSIVPKGNQSTVSAITVDGEEELGLFDVAENLAAHAELATKTLGDITDSLAQMTTTVSYVSEKMGGIAQLRIIEPAEAKPLIALVSNAMDDYSLFIESNLPVFSENSIAMSEDIRMLIDFSYDFVKTDPNSTNNMYPFRKMLESLLDQMDASSAGFSSMLDAIRGLQRTTSVFNKARRRVVLNGESMITSIYQIKEILRQALEEVTELIRYAESLPPQEGGADTA